MLTILHFPLYKVLPAPNATLRKNYFLRIEVWFISGRISRGPTHSFLCFIYIDARTLLLDTL